MHLKGNLDTITNIDYGNQGFKNFVEFIKISMSLGDVTLQNHLQQRQTKFSCLYQENHAVPCIMRNVLSDRVCCLFSLGSSKNEEKMQKPTTKSLPGTSQEFNKEGKVRIRLLAVCVYLVQKVLMYV